MLRGGKWHMELEHVHDSLQSMHCPLGWLN